MPLLKSPNNRSENAAVLLSPSLMSANVHFWSMKNGPLGRGVQPVLSVPRMDEVEYGGLGM